MEPSKHSPLPWHIGTGSDPEDQVFSADGRIVADCKWTNAVYEERLANARLIVEAVNKMGLKPCKNQQ
jgi:hypothetical protein